MVEERIHFKEDFVLFPVSAVIMMENKMKDNPDLLKYLKAYYKAASKYIQSLEDFISTEGGMNLRCVNDREIYNVALTNVIKAEIKLEKKG